MVPNGRQESKPGPRPTASPSYDPENEGAWTGQLPNAGLVDQLPPPIERKEGGPADRLDWLTYQLQKGLKGDVCVMGN